MAPVLDRAAEHVQLAVLQRLHTGNQSQQAGFPGAVRTDQAAPGAGGQAERDVGQHLLLAVSVLKAGGLQRQAGH